MLAYERFKEKFVDKVNEALKERKLYAHAHERKTEHQSEGRMVDLIWILADDSDDEDEIAEEYFWNDRNFEVSLEQLYIRYKQENDMDKLVAELVRKAELKFVPTRIFYVLTDDSEEELNRNHIPHRPFIDDLMIVYHIKGTKDDGDNVFSHLMTDKDAENLNLTEQDLFELASKNTDQQFHPITRSNQDTWMLYYMKVGYPSPKAAYEAYKWCKKYRRVFLCCRYNSPYGITLLLNKQYLRELAEMLGGDYYVTFTCADAFAVMKKEDHEETKGSGMEDCLSINGHSGEYLWPEWKMYLYSKQEDRLRIPLRNNHLCVGELKESDFYEPHEKPPLFETP